MALTKIRGNTQIKLGSITNVEIAANAGIELSKLAEGAELIKRDGSVAFTGNVNLGSHKLVNVAAPTSSTDGANMGYVDAEVAVVQAEVDAEELARAAADTQLQANIDAEALARANADTTLQGNIDSEAAARAAGDLALQGNIDAEAATRLANDNTLQSNIDAEALAREAADSALSDRASDLESRSTELESRMDSAESDIDSLESRASTLENGLQAETQARMADVDAEEARAIAAEVALQAEIDAEEVRAAAAETALQAEIDAEEVRAAAAETALQAEIDAEEVRAIAAEAALQAELDAEEVRAIAAEGVLQDNIDAEEAARILGDNANIASIEAEVAARAAADIVLQGNIDAEAATRLATDNTLQNNIDSEEAARVSADNVLQGNIDTEAAARAAADLVLQGNIDTEAAARISGDASTLASAQAYADQKISDLVDGAPQLLDTLNELAAAIGDDENFAVTIANNVAAVQAEVDAEELARAAADTTLQANINAEAATRLAADDALDARLDILELYKDAQTVYVAKNGNDTTGNGGEHAPFLTLQAALTSITDASPTKRYIIKVKAGAYTETGTVSLKANVFVVGEAKDAVRIGATSFNLHSSFSGSADNRSGIVNAILLNACDFNWATVTSAAGKLYFSDVAFNGSVSMYGHNNAIAQAHFHSCMFYSTFTVSGINVGTHRNNIHYGNITLNQHPNGGMATILAADGGTCSGTVTLAATTNDFNRRCSMFARSFYMEYLTVNGPSAYCDLTDNSMPRDVARVTKTNGGNTSYINTLSPIDTNSRSIGEVGKQYLYNFNYVNASTGSDLYVISMGTSYAADSAGKNIFIEADSYGLNANVNGGNVTIATAETSGTGVRGEVKVDASQLNMNSKKVINLADGVNSKDAVNKSQLDSAVSVLTGDISSLDSRLDVAESDIDSLEGRMMTAEGNIDSLEGRMDTAESDIDALEGRADSSESRLDDLETQTVYIADVVTRETPAGSVDGVNLEFTLAHTVVFGSEQVFLNGLLQEPGVGNDYTISGSVITMNSAPLTNDRIRVTYLKVKGS